MELAGSHALTSLSDDFKARDAASELLESERTRLGVLMVDMTGGPPHPVP